MSQANQANQAGQAKSAGRVEAEKAGRGGGTRGGNIRAEVIQEGAAHGDGEADEALVPARVETFRRRRPRALGEVVTSAHGAGGSASAELIEAVFVDAFRNPALDALGDGAVLSLPSGESLAFSTDSFVVRPLRFPGGSIGDLAVHGTVNDLAMTGARPLWLSAAFVIEEGFPVDELRRVAGDMAEAARAAGVEVVTGDTKVVDTGTADGLIITTAGVGLVPPGRQLAARRVRPGDRVLVSGTIGEHGMAVMIARGNLAIDAAIRSDTAAVDALVEELLAAAPSTRWLRDPTRGGVGTACNELARDSGLGVLLDERSVPVRPDVRGACELLGIDPLHVANEGRFLAVVPPEQAPAALAALREHPRGRSAAVIGEITEGPAGIVAMRTALGGTRIVDMLVGDPLPRIC
ncbi:hydrogenase expression/formation protein HypE [Candidatus Protofrankia datiscae]|uniref:Hydrogenase expression/formation protein HypE n=1 Tax=Candidatus Protofrankia datiscae TaxID=2716812 RepID=F8B251_9ACTN|nr:MULTISPECIES: hydrogenase expression/formation protein HypE [Protofrankia]AEH09845.1 hydrogenase expression/formation protein HypE [Candidatus Protofrankia datiscae]